MMLSFKNHCQLVAFCMLATTFNMAHAFVPSRSSVAFVPSLSIPRHSNVPATCNHRCSLLSATKTNKGDQGDHLMRVAEEDEGVAIPFIEAGGNSFIECYADSIAMLGGVEYTIGVPCDYCVALCYFEPDGNLVPVELNDKLMDDIFPVAQNIVDEEFGEELALERTPQTLTLVGELEEDETDDDMDDDEEDEDEDAVAGEEDVEVLLSFEHRGTEFNLVRLLDPVLLVGKRNAERPEIRDLLTPEESDRVMPLLEEMFLKYHEERDGTMLP